ncbi:holin [Dermabacteraceae bacterium P7074]
MDMLMTSFGIALVGVISIVLGGLIGLAGQLLSRSHLEYRISGQREELVNQTRVFANETKKDLDETECLGRAEAHLDVQCANTTTEGYAHSVFRGVGTHRKGTDMSVYTEKTFWIEVAKRAANTFAQSLIGLVSADGLVLLDTGWDRALSVAGMAALTSVLTSLTSTNIQASKVLWVSMLERSLKAVAQSLLAVVGTGSAGLLDVDWRQAIFVAGTAAGMSVLTTALGAADAEAPRGRHARREKTSDVDEGGGGA